MPHMRRTVLDHGTEHSLNPSATTMAGRGGDEGKPGSDSGPAPQPPSRGLLNQNNLEHTSSLRDNSEAFVSGVAEAAGNRHTNNNNNNKASISSSVTSSARADSRPDIDSLAGTRSAAVLNQTSNYICPLQETLTADVHRPGRDDQQGRTPGHGTIDQQASSTELGKAKSSSGTNRDYNRHQQVGVAGGSPGLGHNTDDRLCLTSDGDEQSGHGSSTTTTHPAAQLSSSSSVVTSNNNNDHYTDSPPQHIDLTFPPTNYLPRSSQEKTGNSSPREDNSSKGSNDSDSEEPSVTDPLLPETANFPLGAQKNKKSVAGAGLSDAVTDHRPAMNKFMLADNYGPTGDYSSNGIENKVDPSINGVYPDGTPYSGIDDPVKMNGDVGRDGAGGKDGGGSNSGDGNEEEDDDSGPCGWKGFRFGFCQKFRDARWFLVVLTLCGACQGMAVNGFVNTVISTVERRFEISSTESGLIASCYDIMFVLLVIPISYFGGQGHKPRYLGIGIFVLGLGSFVFCLPHFISDSYTVENAQETTCKVHSNDTSSCSTTGSSSLSNYKYFFFLGQLLHGAGATPLYTLGVTYIDENVPQRSSSFFNGIFYTGAIIGPALGYMVGSEFLNIYTDLSVDPKSLGLDTNNPKWVGAWWIGFLISGTFGVLLSLPLLAFPSALPGSRKYEAERGKEVQASSKVDQTGKHRGFWDILLSIKYLLTNIPFMLINIAAAADGILVAGFSTFMPKYIEYQFGLSAGTAALYVGLAVVPAGGGATFLGGFLVRCMNLKVRGILRLCVIASFTLSILAVALLMECDTTPFAGVTLPYGQTNVDKATFLGKNLVDSCNANCSCAEEDYFPICGRDKVLYFSPCYAGCTDVLIDGDVKKYSNCSCINYNFTAEDYQNGDLHMGEFGKCEYKCNWLVLFMLCFSVMIVFVFITSMPSLTATLRCVPDHQRSFGLGIQWIVARCLGSIPGPILFGKMFDLACLVWQKRCDGDGSCFFYDNHEMSINLLSLALVFAAVAAFAFLFALCLYKVKEVDDEIALNINGPSRQSSRNSITPTIATDTTSPVPAASEHTHPRKSVDGGYDNAEYTGTNL